MKIIGIGRTAEVFELENNRVLKLYRKSIPNNFVDYEMKVNELLISKALDIPKVFELKEVNERKGIIFEKLKGPTLLKKLILSPFSFNKLAENFANLHLGLQNSIEGLKDNSEILISNIKNAPLLNDEEKIFLVDLTTTLPTGDKICHGDFHPDNIIVSSKKLYIIDWMTASSGNPISDIARTSILFKYAYLPEEKSYLEKLIISKVRSKFYKVYIQTILKNSNFSKEEISIWEIPHLAARLVEYLPPQEKELLLGILRDRVSKLKR